MKDVFEWLQQWYQSQCDGDWEHEFGIKIDTLDNPGWVLNVDLIGTDIESKEFNKVNSQITEDNWIQCDVQNGVFKGACGPKNLTELVEIFIDWTETFSEK